MQMRTRRLMFVITTWLLLCVGVLGAAEWRFEVQFSDLAHKEPFTGRVYLAFTQSQREPRFSPENWFGSDPFVARDVENWRPGEVLVFSAAESDGLLACPVPMAEMDLAGMRVQAIARFNPYEREVAKGPGNGYSNVVDLGGEPATDAVPRLVIDELVPEPKFKETETVKLLEVRSQLLSDFHGREVSLKAAVSLPASYRSEPERRYPTIFVIPGFGGTHFSALRQTPLREEGAMGVEFLRVTLDPSCPLGHHVFADSANNGPVGQALISELIPEFERKFRSVPEPAARFLTGHSSGGWSSLWLQVTYPDDFGGTWSTSPDPVDFRDFQQINVYRVGENMYVDPQGEERPLARNGETVLIRFRDFALREWAVGHGGQLHSFEAVFSPRGTDERPQLLWNRTSGEIDHTVAEAWKPYDIRLKLEEHWSTLGPKLSGKLHVFMGDQDTFYLDGATRLLKESLERLHSDAVVEIHPDKNHSNLLSPELRRRIVAEMEAAYLQHAAR